MIPLRITMKGFLCFKEEQVLDFNGASLWVLSGGNGRGKSAVFDAMTFALFGAHRGGKTDFQKLINDESDRLAVDFEVDLGGSVYHIHRSLARGNRSVERQVFFHEPGGRGPAVPETHTDAGYKAWLADRLGLSYETFTTSVLLLQGQSEKLLSANPESRKTVLGDVADIAAYQALHKVADERRRDGAAAAKEARHRLNARPPIDPATIEEAAQEVIEAEAKLVEARLCSVN
jgi:DNA repair protein SbcC/Rad50